MTRVPLSQSQVNQHFSTVFEHISTVTAVLQAVRNGLDLADHRDAVDKLIVESAIAHDALRLLADDAGADR